MAVVLVLLLLPLVFWAGYKLCARRSIDYKKRWQEALALYEEERAKPLVMGQLSASPNEYRQLSAKHELLRTPHDPHIHVRRPQPKQQSGPKDAQNVLDSLSRLDALAPWPFDKPKSSAPRLTALRLRSLSDQQRYETEGARLDNGLDVIDDLIDIDGHWTTMMLKRRAEHGIG